jgi:DNA-directed RNA polymerase specialized sigma24 family protein
LLRARLIGFCVARAAGLSAWDGENAGQEVVSRILRMRTPFEAWPRVRAEAWATRVAQNVVHEMWRDQRKRRGEIVDWDLLPGSGTDLLDIVSARGDAGESQHGMCNATSSAPEAWEWIGLHLDLLTPKQALALLALRDCGCSREAARRLGIDHASFLERIDRVTARLRDAWLEQESGQGVQRPASGRRSGARVCPPGTPPENPTTCH